jgi:predicted SAM-dependent methyltransferase
MKALNAWLGRITNQWVGSFQKRHHLVPINATSQEANQPRTLLHVACGRAYKSDIHLAGFHDVPWREVRLDADAAVMPDIVGSMVNMSAVPSGYADAIFSSHGIEHLYWHDVPVALAEFYRTLKDDGFLVVTCPDLQTAAQMIAEDRLFDTAYVSEAGPISPFDMVFSYRPFVQANPQWMAHHCGFTLSTLLAVVKESGFQSCYGIRRIGGFDLWVLGSKKKRTPEELTTLAASYLPQTA